MSRAFRPDHPGMDQQPPLNWEASANPTNSTVSDCLPPEVVACLRNARFLHLATCADSVPHISLMSYTYLPGTPFSPLPTIIMTTNPSSRKTSNLYANPRVSLLVHDWVSHRSSGGGGGGGPGDSASPSSASFSLSSPTEAEGPEQQRRGSSGLASLLLGLNTAALGRISATITGTARILQEGGQEERWCRARHVEAHGFKESAVVEEEEEEEEEAGGGGGERKVGREGNGVGAGWEDGSRRATTQQQQQDGGAGAGRGFLEGEDVRVVVVTVQEGRIANWKGGVKDFVLSQPSRPEPEGGRAGGMGTQQQQQQPVVNGTST